MPLLSPLPIFRLTIAGGGVLLLFFGGCASPKPKTGPAAAPAPFIHPIVGQIAIVNEAERFVLVDLGSNLYVPAPGTLLHSTNAAGKIAHLKASPEQKNPFVAADIIDGEPTVGDEVER